MKTRYGGKKTPAMSRPSPLNALTTKSRSKKKVIRAAKPTPALKAVLTKFLNGKTETKYVAETIQSLTTPANNGFVREVLAGTDANTRLRRMLPNLSQGVGSNQRIGTVITPIKVRITIKYVIDQNYTNADKINLRQYVVTNKMVKTWPLWDTNSQVQQSSMLEVGNGTNTYPDFGAGPEFIQNASRHLNKATFTKLKGSRDYTFAKQGGYTHGALTSAADYAYTPYIGAVEHTSVVSLKCPKLKYEQFVEAGQDNYLQPTNYCPLVGAIAWNASTQQANTYRNQQGAISGGAVGVPTVPIIRYTIFSEMWFKDD